VQEPWPRTGTSDGSVAVGSTWHCAVRATKLATLKPPVSAPVTLIVLVAAGTGSSPTTRTMAATTRDALGPSARVVVRETNGEPSDAEALAVEQSDRADAIVELSWGDPQRRQAKLRTHVARSGRWIDRSIGFRPSDADAERGRTIGFAVASILPEAPTEGSEPSVSSTPAPPPVAVSPASRPALGAAPGTPATAIATPAAIAETPASVTRDGPSTASASAVVAAAQTSENANTTVVSEDAHAVRAMDGLIAIDVLSMGATGIGGDAGGFGAGAAVHWFVRRQFSMRVGGGIRGGTVGAADASTLTAFASVGAVFHAWEATPDRPFGGSVRLDYLLLDQAMTHFVSGGSNQSEARWLSGLDVLVDGSWRFASDVDAILGVGLEDVFAPTYVNLQGARVATLPALRVVAEAGLRLRF